MSNGAPHSETLHVRQGLSRAGATSELAVGLGPPNIALEPTASSFGSATLRLRFRRRLTAGAQHYTQVTKALYISYLWRTIALGGVLKLPKKSRT